MSIMNRYGHLLPKDRTTTQFTETISASWRDALAALLTTATSKKRWEILDGNSDLKHWFAAPLALQLNMGGDSTTASVFSTSVIEAVVATIKVGWLTNTRWKLCKARDCAKLYELRNAHKRQFCSVDCAHLMASRTHQKKK